MARAAIVHERAYQEDDGLYQLPKDGIEHDRLDGQSSALIALMSGRPFHAPLKSPQRILDVGCGTGAMTNLLAAIFPQAEVIGIDIAPIPESRHGKLHNVEYVQGDIRDLSDQDPKFQFSSFGYVFERLLVFGMTKWPEHMALLTSLVRPGGWLETQEADMMLYSENGDRISDTYWWYQHFVQDSQAAGLDVNVGNRIADVLEGTSSLENISQSIYHFHPIARQGFPQFAGLEGQLSTLFPIVLRKVSGTTRSVEFLDKMEKDLLSKYDDGFVAGDHHRFYSAVGQRQE